MGEHEKARSVAKGMVDRYIAESEANRERRAVQMPDDSAALNILHGAYQRLMDLGWREAVYCPKDGTVFEVIEAGSCGIHRCHYSGEWPKGGWWLYDSGDLYPSRPILFRLIKD
jgi:hypothetical protein